MYWYLVACRVIRAGPCQFVLCWTKQEGSDRIRKNYPDPHTWEETGEKVQTSTINTGTRT